MSRAVQRKIPESAARRRRRCATGRTPGSAALAYPSVLEGRERDGAPIGIAAALGERVEEPVAQHTCDRHGDFSLATGLQGQPDVLQAEFEPEPGRLKLPVDNGLS